MAQAQVARTFAHEITSICQRNPELPAVLWGINLDNRIDDGDPLDYAQVVELKRVAQALEAIRGEFRSTNRREHHF